MNDDVSPHPDEVDVHLRVTLRGEQLDFAACPTAALFFVEAQRQDHYIDEVDVIPGAATGLRRLPTERLYDGP